MHESDNLHVVRIFRIWFVVLLAALLPVRGAMAAAMLCPPAGVGTQSELRLMATDDQAVGHDHAVDGHAHTHASHSDHGQSGTDKCNLCSAFCSITPLLSAMPSVPQPFDLMAASFPDLSAPAPSFLSDGQERPPRSI